MVYNELTMDNLSPEIIKYIKEDSAFQIFLNYVASVIENLDTVEGMEKLSDKEAAEKAKVNALTIKKLKEILSPVVDFNERSGPSIASVKKAKDDVGL